MDDIQESRKGHLKGKKGKGEGADVTKAPKQWLKQLMPGARHLEQQFCGFRSASFFRSAVFVHTTQCQLSRSSIVCSATLQGTANKDRERESPV